MLGDQSVDPPAVGLLRGIEGTDAVGAEHLVLDVEVVDRGIVDGIGQRDDRVQQVFGDRPGQSHQVVVRRRRPRRCRESRHMVVVDGPQVLPSHDVLAGPVQSHRLGERYSRRAVPTAREHQCPAGSPDPVDTGGEQFRTDAPAAPGRVNGDENVTDVGVVAHRHADPEHCDHRAVRIPGNGGLRRFTVPAMPEAGNEIVDGRVQLLRAIDEPRRLRHGDSPGHVGDRRMSRVDPGNLHDVTQALHKSVARLICRNPRGRSRRGRCGKWVPCASGKDFNPGAHGRSDVTGVTPLDAATQCAQIPGTAGPGR